MINEPDGLDKRAQAVRASEEDGTISDDYAETWRMGEKVEATLIAERGPGNLIGVKGGLYMRADEFTSIHPVGGDPADLKVLKALRTQLVEERLAAATARSEKLVEARRDKERITDLANQLNKANRDLSAMNARYRLAEAALRHIHELDARGPLAPLPFLDVLLGAEDRPGSVVKPCDAVFTINKRYPGCGCDDPCLIEAATHPCMLPLGHGFVSGNERHRTLDGEEFETGETVVVGEDD